MEKDMVMAMVTGTATDSAARRRTNFYPDYQIKAITNKLPARMSLIRAGLKNTTGGYIYDEQ